MMVMFYVPSDELMDIFHLFFSDFAYKRIDLVTGGVIVIGIVTGVQCFICCPLLYIIVCAWY